MPEEKFMAIPTTRTNEAGKISINTRICKGCGRCVDVCKDFGLILKDEKACKSENPIFGCIACGHCMAICPTGAIKIKGRTLSPDDLFELPERDSFPSFESLLSLLKNRRSIREFRDIPVEKNLIEKILEAASTAPMGLPPSDVHVLVLTTKDSVRKFSEDFCAYLKGLKWFVSSWFLAIIRPFFGRTNTDLLRDFARPLIYKYTESMDKGENLVTYDAPAALYFYGSPYCDPADPIVAATYAMIAAESLNLGTCMLGAIHPMIQSGKAAAKFRKQHGIKHKSREGLFVILGYPRVKYEKGIRRTFASVDTA
jgi:ferredoxin